MTGTSGRPYRGRRDNGLDATEFVALADVDPRIGEHLLDVLGVIGIAAYLAPSADLNPVVRSTSLPARPTDRLWVDRDRLEEARGLLEAVQEDARSAAASDGTESPGASRPIEIDVDVEWERIIAGYDATAAPDRPRRRALTDPPESGPTGSGPTGSGPAGSGTTGSGTTGSGTTGSGTTGGASSGTETAGNGAAENAAPADGTAALPALTDPTADPLPVRTPGTADQPVRPDEPAGRTDDAPAPDAPSAEPSGAGKDTGRPLGRDRLTGTDAPPSDFAVDEDEGYEPPPPPPLPRMSAPVIGALLAIAAGLVLLFRSDTLGLSEHVRLLLSLCGILGGAGALVWRLRDGWNDDDPDDGAVV
ncbi:hypothetical protein [Cryptosporangium japonicum]|uniref:DUF308 domain-containing protein n=1 Tax=Cryptosporangium japonicum TaxID=80872 RepID=A0ABN0UAJ9_9ACTN